MMDLQSKGMHAKGMKCHQGQSAQPLHHLHYFLTTTPRNH